MLRKWVHTVVVSVTLALVGVNAQAEVPSCPDLGGSNSIVDSGRSNAVGRNDSGDGRWLLGLRGRRIQDPGALFDWRCQSEGAKIAGLDEGLMSDRPDFTEASTVVGLGVLQIETGYTYLYDNDGTIRTKSHSYPETLIRYGIFRNWLELRVGSNYGTGHDDSTRTSGAEDLYLGFKIGLTAQDGIRPEMALIPQMTVPTGANGITSNEVLPGANWLYGWDISENLATGGSTQFNRSVDGTTGSAYTEWSQSWTVNYGLTERLGAFTEWFAHFPSGAQTERTQYYFDGGFVYSFTNDIQWDIRGGKGLNDAAADYFLGTGLVLRFH